MLILLATGSTFYMNSAYADIWTDLFGGFTDKYEKLYLDLKKDYDILTSNYNILSSSHDVIYSDYNEIYSEHETVLSDYDKLYSEHETVLSDYDNLYYVCQDTDSEHDDSLYCSFIDSEYENLYSEYETLFSDYEDLYYVCNDIHSEYNDNSDCNAINSEYENLYSDYNDLISAYEDLNSKYQIVKSAYDILNDKSKHNDLISKYNDLVSKYNNLKSDYSGIESHNQQLQTNQYPITTISKTIVTFEFHDSKKNYYKWTIPIKTFESRVIDGDQVSRFNDFGLDIKTDITGKTSKIPSFHGFIKKDFSRVIDQVYDNANSKTDFIKEVWYIVSKLTIYDKDIDIGSEGRYALETLTRTGGDCEDLTILIADMLMSSKHTKDWTFRYVYMDSDNPTNPQEINHLILYVHDGQNKHFIEATGKDPNHNYFPNGVKGEYVKPTEF